MPSGRFRLQISIIIILGSDNPVIIGKKLSEISRNCLFCSIGNKLFLIFIFSTDLRPQLAFLEKKCHQVVKAAMEASALSQFR
jgi:hypothetical protein